jgi:hypothetical protein
MTGIQAPGRSLRMRIYLNTGDWLFEKTGDKIELKERFGEKTEQWALRK